MFGRNLACIAERHALGDATSGTRVWPVTLALVNAAFYFRRRYFALERSTNFTSTNLSVTQ